VKSAYRVPNRQLNIAVYGISVYRCITTYYLESLYHTYGLPMGERCSLLNLGSKNQRSSALNIEVQIWFLGSKVLCFPLRDTVSHIWITHGRKIFPIEFGSKGQRSSALDIEVEMWFQGSIMTPYHTYGLTMGCKITKFYQALSLSSRERGNLYLLTPLRFWGMRGYQSEPCSQNFLFKSNKPKILYIETNFTTK
jgi:hypothetical protein